MNLSDSKYEGDFVDSSPPPTGEYKTPMEFDNPFDLVCFFDNLIADGQVTLHKWQHDVLLDLSNAKANSQHPCKYCLIAANGSGKDKFIIAPFAIWFVLCKVKSLVIITTASGTQLTSQTEPYIKDLAEKVNSFFQCEVFRIRQRYIKCILTGSEIRMFATDEKGKAEGYHPVEPNREMAIIVNEGKSVTDEIHSALRRCTGYNYWLEVSSAGEPRGFFYKAATTWPNVKRVTSYDCSHMSSEDIIEDKNSDGEHSAFFRSKHLSLFTSIDGSTVINEDLLNDLIKNRPTYLFSDWPIRIGIDLAAGGDENVICFTRGSVCIKEIHFRETDTVVGAERIAKILKDNNIDKNYKHIYADDGGVGRSIIDMLVHKGWSVNRVMNQWPAISNRKQFGNRGAENWYRVNRILEERYFDVATLSERTITQLRSRHYKQTSGGKIFLRSKKEEKAEGFPSPDRADAFILSLTGLTVESFQIEAPKIKSDKLVYPTDNRPKITLESVDEIEEHYSNKVTYANYEDLINTTIKKTKRTFKTLRERLKC